MDIFGLNKVVDALWRRGLGFLVMWGYITYNIATRDAILGLSIEDADKGLIIVFLTLIFVILHHLVRFLIARYKYYSPASFSSETKQATIAARKILSSFLHQAKSNSLTSTEKLDYVKKTREEVFEIQSMLESDDIKSTFNLAMQSAISAVKNQTSESIEKFGDLKNEFDLKTNWVKKD